MSSGLGLEHSYIWLDCNQDLVEALQLARPDLIVAYPIHWLDPLAKEAVLP